MRKQNRIALWIAAAVCVGCVIFMIAALCRPKQTIRGEFVPPDFAADAQQGIPEVPEELGWFTPQAEGLALKVSLCGEVIVRDGKADIYFTNHEENEDWMLVRIFDEDGAILAQTGMIRPGEYIRTIEFDTVPKDGQIIIYKVMAYEPETYYSTGALTLQTTAQMGG